MKQIITCACILLLILSSGCGKSGSYTDALPKDAALVAAFDLRQIASKTMPDDKDARQFADVLKAMLKGSDALIGEIVEDPSRSGLSVTDKVYLFMGEGSRIAGLLMRVDDSGKVEYLLKLLAEQHVCGMLHETDGFLWTEAGKLLIAYDDEALLVMQNAAGGSVVELSGQAGRLLRQQQEEGFTATDTYRRMAGVEGDITIAASLELLPHRYVSSLMMGVSAELNLRDVKLLASVNFESGKATADVKILSEDRVVNGLISRYIEVTSPIRSDYLDAFPANTCVWLAGNMQGNDFFRLLNSNPMIHRSFENSMLPLDFAAIFGAVKGDVSLAFTNPIRGEFIAYADVTDDAFLQTIDDLKPMVALAGRQMSLSEMGMNAYEFHAVDGSVLGLGRGRVDLYFGVENGRLFITNKKDLQTMKVLGLSLRNCRWGSEVAGKRLCAMLNFNTLKQQFASTCQPGRPLPFLYTVLDKMDYFFVSVAEDKSVHLELTLNDRQTNILRQSLELFLK